jgi:hypothetical protein
VSAAGVICTDMADEFCTVQAGTSISDQGAGDAWEGATGAITPLSGARLEQG